MINAKREFTVLDLFCGCGGLSQGFHDAGFKILAGNDIWGTALETFENMHKGAKPILGDITDEKVRKEIVDTVDRNVDVIIGGPPCQAYSLAGTRDPDDPRGKLFEQYVKLVQKINPKFFVMENVKGILTMKHYREDLTKSEMKERDEILKNIKKLAEKRSKCWSKGDASEHFDKRRKLSSKISRLRKSLRKFQEPVTALIKRKFKDIEYHVEFRKFNAAEFGVPQSRERVFFIGTKKKKDIVFPTKNFSRVTMKDAIGSMPNPRKSPEDEVYNGSFSTIYMSRNRRRGWDDVSFTIQAGIRHLPLHPSSPKMVKKGPDKWIFSNPKKTRRLSFREAAKIQTFPDKYNFCGNQSDKIKQIGNAVPPLLSRRIAEPILKKLEAEFD